MFQILNRDKRTFKQQCQEKKNSPLIELKNNKPIKFDSIHEVMKWSDNSLSINSQSSIYFEFENLLKRIFDSVLFL